MPAHDFAADTSSLASLIAEMKEGRESGRRLMTPLGRVATARLIRSDICLALYCGITVITDRGQTHFPLTRYCDVSCPGGESP